MSTEITSQIISTLTKYAEASVKRQNHNEGSEENIALLDKIQDQVAYYCKADGKREIIDQRFRECVEKISSTSSSDEATLTCKIFEDACTHDSLNVLSDERYEKFLALRKNVSDETICVVKSTQNFTDPLSKKRMVDPVKNTKCGHSYEKSTALEVLKRNPRTRCPMVGCSAFIEKKLLVPDDDLKRRLDNDSHNQDDDDDNNDSQLVSLDDTEEER